VSGLFALRKTAVVCRIATGPDEIRVSEANQALAIIIACPSTVSTDQRSHSVWIFIIIFLALLLSGLLWSLQTGIPCFYHTAAARTGVEPLATKGAR
jgi:hypothetical protein